MGSDDMVLSYNLQGVFLHVLCPDYVYVVCTYVSTYLLFRDGT